MSFAGNQLNLPGSSNSAVSVHPRRLEDVMGEKPFKWTSITFGCQALDQLLDGGLSCNGITEIYGESGTGKSQICMQLAVTAQLPPDRGGTGKGVVYFTTRGGNIPSDRLMSIIRTFQDRYPNLGINYMGNIFIQRNMEVSGLLHCVQHKFPEFLQKQQIGLVIVDSMGIFRHEADKIQRSKNMRCLATCLNSLAKQHDFAVLCVNEATSIPKPGESEIIPSLGLSWSNLVSTRLKLSRTDRTSSNGDVVRMMSYMHSPQVAMESAEFIITGGGVCDL